MAAFPSTVAELGAAAPSFSGRLHLQGRIVPANLALASRLSLLAELEAEHVADGALISGLEVHVNGGIQRLGPCQFKASAKRGCGRLYFTEHLYDCRALLLEGRVVDLRSLFDSVPAVLAQKEQIRPEFREHVAALTYDLAVYKRFFDEQDQFLAAEPSEAAERAGEALLRTEGRRFLAFLDRKVAELEHVVRGYTREEHERHGFYLRRQLWHYLLTSEFFRRTNLKPSGYAGDAELMVMIYENSYVGTSTFGRLMHKHPVETRAADAVRARRGLIPGALREALARAPAREGGRFRFLSLACGPAYELLDVFRDGEDLRRLECVLLDQDTSALELARGVVRRIEAERGAAPAVRYFEDSVRTMLRTRDLPQRFGQHEFVYSMGLFDYLTAPVARAVLARAWELLAPGGTLLVGNYHVGNPTRIHMDYWADWPLTYRTEESFLALADKLPCAARAIEFDETRCQMFLRLEKPA
jgi:extracellular factor (EF) 3-hydroxypalmitic acid methyl ester biosynthesis protein